MLLPAQLQVAGPDSKAAKAKYAAFHVFHNGRTTLSCSCILLVLPAAQQAVEDSTQLSATVLAPVTCIYPFLREASRRHSLPTVTAADLIPAVDISILVRAADLEQALLLNNANSSAYACSHAGEHTHTSNSNNSNSSLLLRLPAQLLCIQQLPAVQSAAQQLLVSTNNASSGDWKLGWCLAEQQPAAAATPAMLSHIAVLSVDLQALLQQTAAAAADSLAQTPAAPAAATRAQHPGPSCGGWEKGAAAAAAGGCVDNATISSCSSSKTTASTPVRQLLLPSWHVLCQGQPVHLTGSPFGCLAEQQFFGAVVTGCISLLLQGTASSTPAAAAAGVGSAAAAAAAAGQPPLLIIDSRCLPGMEGGPIACRCCGGLIGLLSLPLSNCSAQAELLLGICTAHVAAAVQHVPHGTQLVLALQAASCSCGCCSSSTGDHGGGGLNSRSIRQQSRGSLLMQHASAQERLAHPSSQPPPLPQQQQQQQQRQLPLGKPARRLQVHLQHIAGAEDTSLCQLGAQQQLSPPLPLQTALTTSATAAGSVAAAASATTTISSGSGGSSSSAGIAGCGSTLGLQSAAAGVVMVRVAGSWGSGVLITHSGLVLTVAHLFRKTRGTSQSRSAAAAAGGGRGGFSSCSASSGGGRSGLSAVPAQQGSAQQRLYPIPPTQLSVAAEPDVSVRLSLVPNTAVHGNTTATTPTNSSVWLPAKVVYCLHGYLDLALLQISPHSLRNLPPNSLQPLQLVPQECAVTPGSDAYVIGHGLFGPRLGLCPAITAGCVARVVCLPGSNMQQQQQQGGAQDGWRQQQLDVADGGGGGKPSMVISTAAVHSGASGGALVDAGGRLLGLITSNARHVRGQTLPHLNFCISAEELRPLWDWAQQQQQAVSATRKRGEIGVQAEQYGGGAAGVVDAASQLKQQQQRQELRALDDLNSAAGARLWALQPYMHLAAVGPTVPLASSL